MTVKRSVVIALMCSLVWLGCARKPDDAALSDAIKARLFSDATLKGEPIAITVNNGEATLSGEVSSDAVRQQIVSMAQLVPGVSKVNDSLQVKPAAAALAEPLPTEAPSLPPPAASVPAAAPPASAPPPAKPAGLTGTPPDANAKQPAAASNVTPPAPAPAPAPAAPPPPKPRKVTLPEGTNVRVITADAIDSDKNKVGSTFLASLYSPITLGDEVIIPQKSNVYIKLTNVATSGKFKGKDEIHLELDGIEFQGQRYALDSTTYEEAGKSQGKSTAKKAGIGAAVGAGIGAIAGGGKGAAIGAGIGGGAGLATQAFKKGDKLQIPPETKIDFTLEKPLEVTIQPKSAKP